MLKKQGLLFIQSAICNLQSKIFCQGRRKSLDWHSQRGLSFLQLGKRELQRLCYLGLSLPRLIGLPRSKPKPACASRKKRRQMEIRIEFAKVTEFAV